MPVLLSASLSSLITTALLILVATVPSWPMLLGNRFFAQCGHIQIGLHALYSFVLVTIFLKTKSRSKIRSIIWILFSLVFFGQLILGLSGQTIFLQTGKLHYPVPALIVSGPIFRGSGLFMLILLASTILLVGASWCSHLCYVGAIDNILANKNRKKRPIPSGYKYIRFSTLALAIIVPLILKNYFEIFFSHAVILTFIAISLVFFFLSYHYGKMIHCSYFCPVGLITNTLGRFHPFKISIDKSCDSCGACTIKCKYNALSKKQLQKGQAGFNCSLCLDCTDVCHSNSIGLNFFGKRELAIPLYYVIIVALHSTFLAVARI